MDDDALFVLKMFTFLIIMHSASETYSLYTSELRSPKDLGNMYALVVFLTAAMIFGSYKRAKTGSSKAYVLGSFTAIFLVYVLYHKQIAERSTIELLLQHGTAIIYAMATSNYVYYLIADDLQKVKEKNAES